MHKKSFRLFISTLLLSLTVLLGGCGNAQSNNTKVDETSVIEDLNLEPSRFHVEKANISNDVDDFSFNSSYIITDIQTGKQYLYIYHAYCGSICATMVELGSTDKTVSNIDE